MESKARRMLFADDRLPLATTCGSAYGDIRRRCAEESQEHAALMGTERWSTEGLIAMERCELYIWFVFTERTKIVLDFRKSRLGGCVTQICRTEDLLLAAR